MRAARLALLATLLAGAAAADDADAALAAGDPARAIIAVSAAIAAADDPARVAALADRLAPICRARFLAPGDEDPGLGLVTHVVAGGETATTIARRYRVGAGLLARLNRDFEPARLRIGQRLTVLDCAAVALRVEVRASRYRLLVWRGDRLLAAMPCGLGKDGSPTPRGDTRLKLRVRDPEWRDPDSGTIIPPRDPRNILGGYWLGFEPGDDGRFKGIGIHGFTGEASEHWIEKPGSHGCVRLLQPDIAALYDLALVGTAVSVRAVSGGRLRGPRGAR